MINNIFNCKEYVKHVARAIRHSYYGLRAVFLSEHAFRIEIFLSILTIPLAFWIGESIFERVLLLGSWFFVLLIELLNTAIETIINRISLDYHPDSGKAKDIGSALVFISAIQAVFFWSMLGIPWFLKLIK
jgi:diacylglycerol kinase (ATP)